jgi:hypothetical protein
VLSRHAPTVSRGQVIVQRSGSIRLTVSPEAGIDSTAEATVTGLWRQNCLPISLNRLLVFIPLRPAKKLPSDPSCC